MEKDISLNKFRLIIGLLFAFSILFIFVLMQSYKSAISERDSVVLERDAALEKVETLTTNIQELRTQYDELKEDYDTTLEPYKNLSEAEVKAETKAAELKAAEDQKALEEMEAKEAEEAAAKEEAEREAKEKEEKLGYDTGITYSQLSRTPDDYVGKKVKFKGEVVQVMEGDDTVQMRLAVDSDYDNMLYVEYDKTLVSSRILEDDIITIYGVSYGLYSYQSTLGGTITIPSVVVDKIDQ